MRKLFVLSLFEHEVRFSGDLHATNTPPVLSLADE